MLRRLYSTFAGGWPGIGLLVMRLVVGAVLLASAGPPLWSDPTWQTVLPSGSVAASGVLLVAGLWTPLAGTVVAAIEIAQLLRGHADPFVCLLAGTMAAALAMLGPGRWSVDARLFGWKRIDAPVYKSSASIG